jgi:hypothetical protein
VDALLGEQTRRHEDLDLAIPLGGVTTVRNAKDHRDLRLLGERLGLDLPPPYA